MNKTEDEVLEIVNADRDPGPQPHRRRRVVGHGRDPHADRFLARCTEAAIRAGATTINLPDTVGYVDAGGICRACSAGAWKRCRGQTRSIFSTHCHNDLGMAVANSLAGVAGGARQIECTINGLGERAGNAALEEVVMAIRTRGDVLPYHTDIETTHLSRVSKAGLGGLELPGAVQQGDRRQERLRP